MAKQKTTSRDKPRNSPLKRKTAMKSVPHKKNNRSVHTQILKPTRSRAPPIASDTFSRRPFSSSNLDRSKLKPLSTGINNLDQLDHLHGSGDLMNATQLKLKAQEAEVAHQKKLALQQQHSKDGAVPVGQAASNEQIESQLHEINQAANITSPPLHITHPQHSTHFLPMWDPAFVANKELVGSFERTTQYPVSDMDLLGVNVATLVDDTLNVNQNHTTTTLKQRIQQKNHISLVLIASTDATVEYAKVCANLWARQFEKTGQSNQDGAIIAQPTLVSITEGFLGGLFRTSISKKMAEGLDPQYLLPHTFTFHIDKSDGPIARARRFLDCRNRYAANLFLVDERGVVRWKSRIATVPTKEFMETLFNVTNDLILETKFDEAD